MHLSKALLFSALASVTLAVPLAGDPFIVEPVPRPEPEPEPEPLPAPAPRPGDPANPNNPNNDPNLNAPGPGGPGKPTVSAPRASAEPTGGIFSQRVEPTGHDVEPTLQPTIAPTIKDPAQTGASPKATGADTNPNDATVCARDPLNRRCNNAPPYQEPSLQQSRQFAADLSTYQPGSYVQNDAIFNFLSNHVVVRPQKDQTVLYIDGAWTNAADQVMYNDKVSISTMYGGYGKRIFDENQYPMKEIIAQDKANGNQDLKIKFFQATSSYLVKLSSGKVWLAYQGDWKTAMSTDGQRQSIFVTDELPSARLNPDVEGVYQVAPEFATWWNTNTVPAVKLFTTSNDLDAAYKVQIDGGTLPAMQIYQRGQSSS